MMMRGGIDMIAQGDIMAGVEIVLIGGPPVQCTIGVGQVQIMGVLAVQSMTSIMVHMEGVGVLTTVGTAGHLLGGLEPEAFAKSYASRISKFVNYLQYIGGGGVDLGNKLTWMLCSNHVCFKLLCNTVTLELS